MGSLTNSMDARNGSIVCKNEPSSSREQAAVRVRTPSPPLKRRGDVASPQPAPKKFRLENEEVSVTSVNTPSGPVITECTDRDVLSGRGGGTNLHPGNRVYRDLILSHCTEYDMASKAKKPDVSRKIVQIIRERGGRFLGKDESDGKLYDIGDAAAKDKTSQALRHRTFEMRNQKESKSTRKEKKGQKAASYTTNKSKATHASVKTLGSPKSSSVEEDGETLSQCKRFSPVQQEYQVPPTAPTVPNFQHATAEELIIRSSSQHSELLDRQLPLDSLLRRRPAQLGALQPFSHTLGAFGAQRLQVPAMLRTPHLTPVEELLILGGTTRNFLLSGQYPAAPAVNERDLLLSVANQIGGTPSSTLAPLVPTLQLQTAFLTAAKKSMEVRPNSPNSAQSSPRRHL